MMTRTRERTVSFKNAFLLRGVDRTLPAGDYRVTTDEELIESLSFPVYRRLATMIFVPAQDQRGAVEMVTIDPADLQTALRHDATVSGETPGGPQS